MKIAVTTTMFYPIKSGVSRAITSSLLFLKKKYGLEFEVVCISKNNFPKEELLDGIRIRRFKKRICIAKRYSIGSGMLSYLMRKNYDLIHLHHFGYYPATAGFIASRIRKIPAIFTPHFHPPIYGKGRSILFHLYNFTQGQLIFRYCEKIIAITEHEKKLITPYVKQKEKIETIPHPIDVSKFKIKNFERPTFVKEKIVLHVSGLASWKGSDIVLSISKRILKRRRDVSFVFIGRGPLKEKLVKESKKIDESSYIFLENISDDELIKWYNLADVFVLPSYYEAFGMVLAEAQACGTPCVSTKVGGIPEVVIDNKSGFLVEYGDWKSLEEKIIYLLENPKIAKRMGKYGRKHITKNFGIEKVCKKLYELYNSLL